MLKRTEIDIEEIEKRYSISILGQIYDKKRKRNLKLTRNNTGYYRCNVYQHGKRKQIAVHRLVATKHLSNPNNLPDVNHLDGNKANNQLANLEWSSRKENMAHARDSGFFKKAELKATKTNRNKAIVFLYNNGFTQQEIADIFGVTNPRVNHILKRLSRNK